MADMKQTGKNETEKKKDWYEPAGQHDNDFDICAIALQEVVKENTRRNAKPTKKNTSTRITSAIRRDSVLSTDLIEGMVIKAESNAKENNSDKKHDSQNNGEER